MVCDNTMIHRKKLVRYGMQTERWWYKILKRKRCKLNILDLDSSELVLWRRKPAFHPSPSAILCLGSSFGILFAWSETKLGSFTSQGHRLKAGFTNEVEYDRYTFTRTLNMSFESIQPVILDSFRQSPAKARQDSSLGGLCSFPILCLTDEHRFLHFHDFSKLEILGRTLECFTQRVNFALFHYPRLCPRYDTLRCPSW